MRRHSNKIPKESLKPGDHIYSWRCCHTYAHHGIYVGENRVIHFTPGGGQEVRTGTFLGSSPSKTSGEPCPECGDNSNANGVKKSCLKCFLSGGDLHLFLYSVTRNFLLFKSQGGTCTLANSDPPEDVLHRASYLLENGFGAYNLFTNNCEDFAIYCKTGIIVTNNLGRSGQVSDFSVKAFVVLNPLGAVLSLFNLHMLFRDIGFRCDVIKLPVERLVDGLRLGMTEWESLLPHEESPSWSWKRGWKFLISPLPPVMGRRSTPRMEMG